MQSKIAVHSAKEHLFKPIMSSCHANHSRVTNGRPQPETVHVHTPISQTVNLTSSIFLSKPCQDPRNACQAVTQTMQTDKKAISCPVTSAVAQQV